MLRRCLSPLLLASLGLFSAAAHAEPPRFPKLDPNVVRTFETGRVGPFQRFPGEIGFAPVVIELTAPATSATLSMLRAAGAELDVIDGQPAFYDRFVPARVSVSAAEILAQRPEVARVVLRAGRGPLPLDQSRALTRVEDARGARPALDRLTGKGVLVGDVDSAADIYHPTFFRADAGYFDWIDVDGDGVLTPGVDAIDLDLDGKVGPSEIAKQIRADTWVRHLGGSVDGRPAGFDPAIDWLYLDDNANGERDYGAGAGFDDTTPAFGEPLFVPDDVNQNGKLDVGERVIRLGTSKFRKVSIHLVYSSLGLNHKHVYERGLDLASLPTDFSGGTLYGFDDALHATGVLGIVAGDVPLAGRRWVGFAPDAEIVLAFDVDQYESIPVSGTSWALKEKPDVMLYELAPWTGLPLDGTDSMSKMIDTSSMNDGTVHTCPTGDQASARKHTHTELAAGGSASLALDVPDKTKSGKGPLSYVDVTVHVQGGKPSTMTLNGPGGVSINMLSNKMGTIAGSTAKFYTTVQTTSRGTFVADAILYAQAASAVIPVGAWTVDVTGDTAPVTIDAYVADDKSSWALGAGWDKSIATDVSTIGVPSTADHCIAVGAHPSHVDDGTPWFSMYYGSYDVPSGFMEAQGEVRAYSPRGPRIDGVQKPDILAPDNPWTSQQTGDPPYASFQVFGGTSGASPHVTGAAAMLVQAGMKGDEVRDAIRAGAIVEPVAGEVPNGDYGYGRLDVAGALGVTQKSEPPTLTLTVTPAEPTTDDTVVITPKATGEGLEIEWDDGYDGTWDVAYAAVAPRELKSTVPIIRPFKARVRNAAGRIAEAVVWITFKDPAGVIPPTQHPAISASGSGGCGCRASSSEPSLSAIGVAIAALAIAARRRRRPEPRRQAKS
jgi:MYXO-CTERM domain-containing protein